jgi:hypothetical protein
MKCSKRHFQETASAGAVNVDTSAPFGRFAFRGLLSAAARLLDPEVPDVLRKEIVRDDVPRSADALDGIRDGVRCAC